MSGTVLLVETGRTSTALKDTACAEAATFPITRTTTAATALTATALTAVLLVKEGVWSVPRSI